MVVAGLIVSLLRVVVHEHLRVMRPDPLPDVEVWPTVWRSQAVRPMDALASPPKRQLDLLHQAAALLRDRSAAQAFPKSLAVFAVHTIVQELRVRAPDVTSLAPPCSGPRPDITVLCHCRLRTR